MYLNSLIHPHKFSYNKSLFDIFAGDVSDRRLVQYGRQPQQAAGVRVPGRGGECSDTAGGGAAGGCQVRYWLL